jgi:hypothetical protein
MAKTDSLIVLKGTFRGLTFVKSKAYGNHVRSKRGTYKKAKLNKALKASSKRLAAANVPAKIFQDAIREYREGLERGDLWRRLLSMFRKQLRKQGAIDFSKLEPFEIHESYPFNRFMSLFPKATPDKKRSVLGVHIACKVHPEFERSKFIDGYQLTAIGVFPDLEKKTARTVAVQLPVIPLVGKATPLDLELRIPQKAKSFLVCLRMDGCMKGKVNNTPATKGMRMVKAGVV